MITTKALLDWIAPGVPADVHLHREGPDLPDKPDRAFAVSRGPGGREEIEGLQDRGSFTLRARGVPRNHEMPELDILTMRAYLRSLVYPAQVGPWLIRSVWTAGPSYPLPGPDSGRRYEFLQAFNLQVSTDF